MALSSSDVGDEIKPDFFEIFLSLIGRLSIDSSGHCPRERPRSGFSGGPPCSGGHLVAGDGHLRGFPHRSLHRGSLRHPKPSRRQCAEISTPLNKSIICRGGADADLDPPPRIRALHLKLEASKSIPGIQTPPGTYVLRF